MSLNTLATIRAGAAGLENDKIDSNILLRALAYKMEDMVLYNLGDKQTVKRNAGTNKIKESKAVPKAKAAKLYQLFLKPILKMLCCERQLKPCNNLAKVKVEKAIVVATAGLSFKPIKNAAITLIEMIKP